MTTIASLSGADTWRLTGNVASNLDPLTVWARANDLASPLGGGMSYNAGIFTFPTSGVWWVQYVCCKASTIADAFLLDEIKVSLDSGSSYGTGIARVTNHTQPIVNTPRFSGVANALVDVTDESVVRLKIALSNHQVGHTTLGDANISYTSLLFVRLGDTT